VAGLSLTAAFPKASVAGLAWVAPALMLGAALGTGGWTAFRLGYIVGLVHHLTALYWLLFIPVRLAPVVGWLALAGYLALYQGIWVWLSWRLYPAKLKADGLLACAEQFLAVPAFRRAVWALSSAALWVAGEMIRARLLSGFPWNLLGVSQYQMLPLIQVAAVTGVYGVSFVVVWFAVALMGAGLAMLRPPERRQSWAIEIALPLACVLAISAAGFRRLLEPEAPARTLKLALIQPSIPQQMIWNPADSATRFRQVLALSEAALAHRPQVLVWPEATLPGLLRWDTNHYGDSSLAEAVTNLVRRHQVWAVVGADDAEPNPKASEGADFFNASFLIRPDGQLVATYRKRHLVPFGEWMPLARWLPWLRTWTGVTGDFTPGDRPVPFRLTDLGANTSVLICFEDIFPHQARQHVEPETDFLLNLTNNGWFGESAAQWQHAANAVFRAIENGRPLVRCANNGLSCWVDTRGRLHAVFFPDSQDIYRAGFKLVEVPLQPKPAEPSATDDASTTFYWRHGDWFGWGCAGWAGLALGWAWWGRRTYAARQPAEAGLEKESQSWRSYSR
jgi:apolipoprotein N-acyltransferase